MRTVERVQIGARIIAVLCLILFGIERAAEAAPSNVAAWTRFGSNANDQIGGGVGTAGDFNCDGISDLLLGAPNATFTWFGGALLGVQTGWLGVWFGSGTHPPQANVPPDWGVFGNGVNLSAQGGSRLGLVMAAGDVNRDGCDDVIVATKSSASIGPNVRAYFGSTNGPATTFAWRRFLSAEPGSLASGDVNGDGTADIILGLPTAANGQDNEGMVQTWLGSQTLADIPDGVGGADWFAESNQEGAQLGTSVTTGDVNGDGRDDIVAGAPQWDGSIPNSTDTGIAIMWPGMLLLASAADGNPANASWSFQIGTAFAHLGTAVAIPGDLDGDQLADIVVGAPDADTFGSLGTGEGTVVVIRGAAPAPSTDVFNWNHTGFAGGAQIGLGGQLGATVASAGDVNGDGLADYLIGEPNIALTPNQRGRVHLLLGRPTSAWGPSPATDVTFSEPTAFTSTNLSNYGLAIGTAGDWNNDGFSDIVIGAPRTGTVTPTPPQGAGVAFVYLGRGETLASAPVFTQQVGGFQSRLGLGGVAFAGDINHDGFTDVVSGAPTFTSQANQAEEGRIFVNYGGSCGPACAPFFEPIFPGVREGNQAGAYFGLSVSSAGDVNGDGYSDVVAGAPRFDTPILFCFPIDDPGCQRANAGQVRLYLGGSGGLAITESVLLFGSGQQDSQFGNSVASAGDVNGDGFGDVIVSAPFEDVGQQDTGRVYLYLGSATGLASSPSWTKSGTQANARFGIDVAGAGDVNGDGYSDVVIGADGHGASGAAFVYLGRPTNPTFPQGLWNTPIRTLVGSQAGSSFGLTVATAGDLNRDGLSDIAVGAPTFLDDLEIGPQLGAVSIYHGKSPAGPDTTPNTTLFGDYGPGFQNRFGNGVAGAGDVNGDGFGDLIVGDQWFTGIAGFAQGKAYVFHGGQNGITSTTPVRTFENCPHSFCDFGRDVAGAGDVNGDGFSDVLIAAYGFTDTSSAEGAVFVHLGNEGRGTPVQLLQSITFGGAPSATLGATPNWFDASMTLKSPAGRSRVQMEFEVKRLGQDFDGLNTIKGVFLDNGVNPIDLRTFITGSPGEIFHWRARLRSLSPLFGGSRWISLPENAPREMDIRVLPEPGLALALMAGIGALAGLDRRRRRAARGSEGKE